MQGVSVWEAGALMDESSGKVEEVSSFEHYFQDWFPNVCLRKVGWRWSTAQSAEQLTSPLTYRHMLLDLRLENTGNVSSSVLKNKTVSQLVSQVLPKL